MSHFSIQFSNPWLLFLFIPALFIVFFPYFRRPKKFRRTRNRVISVILHTVSMSLLVLLISGISFHYEVPNRDNEVLILTDVSDSGADQEDQKNEFIETVLNASGNDYKVGIVTFGLDPVYAAPLSFDTREVYRQYLTAEKPDASGTDIAAALKFASEQFTNPKTAKIVLVSDGLETDESALTEVRFLTAMGIRVDAVHIANETKPEIQLVGAQMPEDNVITGQKTNITLTIQSNLELDEPVKIILTDKGFDDDPVDTILKKGLQTVEVPHIFQSAGLHDLHFSVESYSDSSTDNNGIYSYLNIMQVEKVLILERNSGESSELQALLEEEYQVDVISTEDVRMGSEPMDVPKTVKELCDYQEIVLVNIANSDLTADYMPVGFDHMLYDYVYELGGSLLTVGGENDKDEQGNSVAHAYSRSDLAGTLYQQMLPVQAIDYSPPLAIMLVIDCSGSMSSGRFEAALKGAEECLNSLDERDFCGVMGFSTTASEEISVLPVSQKETIRTAIRTLNDNGAGSGGTVFSSAIDKAGRALAPIPVERKHIILVTDGNPSDHLEESGQNDVNAYGKYIDYNYNQNGITMSVITVGMSGSREQMEKTAQRGHGKYYDVPLNAAPDLVGGYMRKDLASVELSEMQEGTITPQIKDITSVLNGIDSTTDIPSLKGYYGTKAKEGAKVPLVYQYVPIYAEWRFGEGSVGSFMSALNSEWASDFLTDDEDVGRLLVKNIAASLTPRQELEPDRLTVILKKRTDNYTSRVDVYTDLNDGDRVTVRVAPASAAGDDITVTPYGDNVSFSFRIMTPGLYRVTVEKTDSFGNVTADLSFYQTFSYSKEYDVFREGSEGKALLEELTGQGKGVMVDDPVEIFGTFQKTLPKTVDPRVAFLIIAIVFELLDIAVRKFKFKWLHEIIRDRKELKNMDEKRDRQ